MVAVQTIVEMLVDNVREIITKLSRQFFIKQNTAERKNLYSPDFYGISLANVMVFSALYD